MSDVAVRHEHRGAQVVTLLLVAFALLLRHRPGAARRALYVSAVSGIVGLLGAVLSIVALVMLRRDER